MKTKLLSRLSTFVLVFVLCFLALVGCASNNMELPEAKSVVTGNGGVAVQKGEYLYFVNGYTSVSDMTEGDNRGGEEYSALYRAKLGENNLLSYNEDGELQNCERIVDKVCGFEKTALYIFGDYIYYATPNIEKVANDEHQTVANFELTDFYRAKLDGSGKTLIYKTNLASENTKFAFYKVNDVKDVYLALYDGTKLVFVNCSNKKVYTICDSVSSVAMPSIDVYNEENNTISKGASNVYYTRSGKDEENLLSGNVIARAEIGKNEEVVISRSNYTYSVLMANNDALVFTRKSDLEENANNYVVTYKYGQDGELSLDVQNKAEKLDNTAHSTIFLATYENGNPTGIITTNKSSKLVYIRLQNQPPVVLNEEKTLTPLFVSGNFVYAYDSSNNLYQINYKTPENQVMLIDMSRETEDNKMHKPYFDGKVKFSVNGTYVYFFAIYEGDEETGYYLNRVSALSYDAENYAVELVGKVQSKHIKTDEEES